MMCMKFVRFIKVFLIILLLSLLPFVLADNVYYDKEHVNSINNGDANRFQTFRMDDRPDHLLWFIQISDIHLSYLNNEERTQAFENFTTETLDTINPRVVLVSGDLTDGRGKGIYDVGQNDEEWEAYNRIVTKSKVQEKTVWLDIRGNHDTFNAGYHSSNSSHFKRYSVQGGNHIHSYMQLINGTSAGELYSFIAVDSTLEPGPKRTLNFLGMLTQPETERIEHLIDESIKAGANYTIWFGHYPTSCIATANTDRRSLESIISGYDTSLAYLCGHLHTFMGLSSTMYTMQRDKFLELEVADFKSCRRYRLAAIDHGVFSFVDITHGQWPVILITNPKHSLFHIPHRREANMQLESTHIRILVFSPTAQIKKCIVQIDGLFEVNCIHVENSKNLFVAPWDPNQYKDGLHYISVTVEDRAGRVNKVNQPFRLDGQQTLSFGFTSNFLLNIHFRSATLWVFWLSFTLTIAPLVFVRIWHELVRWDILQRRKRNGERRCQLFTTISQRYWLLSSVDRLFWPIIVYCIYIAVGPWMYCEIIDDKYGLVFAWGILVDGSYLYGSLTYMYGAFQLLLCQFPLILIFSICVSRRYHQIVIDDLTPGLIRDQGCFACCHRRRSNNNKMEATFYVILAVELAQTICLAIVYDPIAIATSVIRTWSIILNIYLWYFSRKLPKTALRSGIYAWSGRLKEDTENQELDSNET